MIGHGSSAAFISVSLSLVAYDPSLYGVRAMWDEAIERLHATWTQWMGWADIGCCSSKSKTPRAAAAGGAEGSSAGPSAQIR